jgi:selenocysteine lyase/cysteine desulfurase
MVAAESVVGQWLWSLDLRREVFDVDFAREQFPFFGVDHGQEWVFLDNAGGTFPCRQVVDNLTRYYRENKVQPYGDNALAAAAGDQMDEGRRVLADLLGVDPETVTLGPSTTQNLNTLSIACSTFLGKGHEIIVSEQDHEANVGGWERVAQQTGATLRFWPIDTLTGELDIGNFKMMLNDRTKIVCVTHSSNIVGSLNPIQAIIRAGHEAGARVIIDGVSFAPHSWPDLSATKADAYCFSTYKTYGTHLGVMYVAPDFASQLAPQCHFFNAKKPGGKLDAAGPDHASIAALAGLGDFFSALHERQFANVQATPNQKVTTVSRLMHRHEQATCGRVLQCLNSLPVRIIGRADMADREANISFVSPNHSSASLAKGLAERGIATKNGHFYAFRLLEKIGVAPDDGVLRLSFAHYNTEEEATRVIDALNAILA